MNTIDPLDRARKALYTDCLKTWLECWRDTPPDECQGMVRGYIDAHLLDRGVALPTEDDVGERIEAADIAVSSGDLYYRAKEIRLSLWLDCWWVLGAATEDRDVEEFMLDRITRKLNQYRDDDRHSSLDGGIWGYGRNTEDIRWWCALYARYGKRIFWGEGYT